jgi:antitoxin ParD1/3/4
MATRTTLNVSLPVELGAFVQGLVSSGRYASASEVVRTALRLLQERELQPSGNVAPHPLT